MHGGGAPRMMLPLLLLLLLLRFSSPSVCKRASAVSAFQASQSTKKNKTPLSLIFARRTLCTQELYKLTCSKKVAVS